MTTDEKTPDSTTSGAGPNGKRSDVIAAVLAAMEDVPESRMAEVATAAVKSVPDAKKVDVVTAAVNAAPPASKADVAAAGLKAVPESSKAAALNNAIDSAPPSVGRQVADRLQPDQWAMNWIWLIIVGAFAIVAIATTGALIGAVFVSSWRKVAPEHLQILLTVFTTVAGILAGFIGGRVSRRSGSV